MRQAAALAVIVATVVLLSCSGSPHHTRKSERRFEGARDATPQNIIVPPGYEIAAVATGLTFPTGVAFDEAGVPHVVESGYARGEVWAEPRLIRIEPNNQTVVAQGQRNGPWNGAAFKDGKFFVAEGGQMKGGRILQIGKGGEFKILVAGLPSRGDHHTSGPAIGPDGLLYFGQGTTTNAGVVGVDNFELGWLPRFPGIHDVPCQDVTLAGRNFHSPNVLSDDEIEPGVQTGAFKPFGQASQPGEIIRGSVPCNGAVMRLNENNQVELVAWGFRNPFGLGFGPDGKLYVTDHGYDERGSRIVPSAGDPLWAVRPGAWYGWPEFAGDANGPPEAVLARHPGKVPPPAATFGVQASPGGFDFSTSQNFGHVGEAFVALSGDRMPADGHGRAPSGFKVVRVNVATGEVEDFAVNRGAGGPASALRNDGLERPIAVRFAPHGMAMYIVDFGIVHLGEEGPQPIRGTGVLWRVTRKAAPMPKPG